jgi:hypothetical protein
VGASAYNSFAQDRHVVGLVPTLADGLLERPQVEHLLAAFASKDPFAGSQMLVGPGGVGKTQLAAAVARRLIDTADLDVAVWVPARNRAEVVSAYAEAARLVLDIEPKDADAAAYRFAQWLRTPAGRWLVVLDAVDDPSDLYGLWPSTANAGQLVVATREFDRGRTARGRPVPVDCFTADQVRTYLAEQLPSESQLVGADGLDRRPLLLRLAVGYLAEFDVTCAEYAARLALTWHRARKSVYVYMFSSPVVSAVAQPGADLPELPAGEDMLAAILLAVNAAEQSHPGLARPLLALLSLLEPSGVPATVITASSTLDYLTAQRQGEAPVNAEQARACLAYLARLNVVELLDDQREIRMHKQLQDVVRRHAGGIETAARVAATALSQVWPEVEPDLATGRMLRANADVLQRNLRNNPLERDDAVYGHRESGVHRLAWRMARSLREAGLISFAVGHLADRLRKAEDLLDEDHPDMLRLQSELEALLGAERWADEAVVGRVLDEMYRHGLPNTPLIRHYLYRSGEKPTQPLDLVAAFFEQLRLPWRPDLSADPELTTTQTVARQMLGRMKSRPDLRTVERIADALGRANDAAGAADELQRLLVQRLRQMRGDLADLLGKAGDAAGAAAEYEALVMYEIALFGEDSVSFFRDHYWSRLGYWRGRLGDAAGAAAAYEHELAEILALHGPTYSRRASMAARWNLAFWRGQSGDAAGAVAEFEQLLEIELALFDAWDGEIKITRDLIARWQARAAEADPDPGAWAADIDEAFWESVDKQYWRFRERRD